MANKQCIVPLVTSASQVSSSAHVSIYICDTYAGRPVTGLVIGDLGVMLDTGNIHSATSTTVWSDRYTRFADLLTSDFNWTGQHIFNGSAFTVNSATSELNALSAINYTGTALGNVSGVTVVGNGADPPAAGRMGVVNRTGQNASIAAVKLADATAAGLYRVSYFLRCTTADAVSAATVSFSILYTDNVGDSYETSANAALAATNRVSGSFVAYLASGNIQWLTAVTGLPLTADYQIRARCEYLGP